MDQIIICPKCQQEIPLTDAITDPIRQKLEKSFQAKLKKRDAELAEKEAALEVREEQIEKAKRTIDGQITQKIKLEREKLQKEAQKKAQEEAKVIVEDLQNQAKELTAKLKIAQDAELDLRKRERVLVAKQEAFELEMSRKMETEKEKIKADVLKLAAEDNRLKIMEKDKQLQDLRNEITEWKRKAEQSSQQVQGEIVELDLEQILKATFPGDEILPVPKGTPGADAIQRVINISLGGQQCGTIIWESKQTKDWSDKWIQKLKDDQREVKAELAILRTRSLPKEIANFGLLDGIWVTDYRSSVPLATALRKGLVELQMARAASTGKNEKVEAVYGYLTSTAFRQRIEAIVEAFTSMKRDLDKEKLAMNRIWSKRDQQINRVLISTTGMYGDLQAIVGATLPQIESLELDALPPGPTESEEPAGEPEDSPF